MKVLCYINHFFGQNPYFLGKSSFPEGTNATEIQIKAEVRKKYVEQVIAQARKIENTDVKVCGIEGYSLVPLDITFEKIREKPLWMIYESLNDMTRFLNEYDYFINLEDDVFLPEETFRNVIEFDKTSLINEIFLPNRLEKTFEGESYCVDFMPLPGWTQQRKKFKGKDLRVALNAHSALLILSKEKFSYALKHVDRNFRQILLHNELDSAFAYFHSPFSLFRSEDISFHYVTHLDKWYNSAAKLMNADPWSSRIRSIRTTDFIPPIFVKIYSFLINRIKSGLRSGKQDKQS